MQARYYDPLIGRFYSNDPVGFRDVHSFNRYAYGNNNPYRYTEPDGKAAESWMNRPGGVSIRQHQAAMGKAGGAAISRHPVGMVALAVVKVAAVLNESATPEVPSGIVGDQSDARAGPARGKRWNSGILTPENGGTGDAEADFEGPISEGEGGEHLPSRPEGSRTAPNGATIRPGKAGEGSRIDIPANGGKPPETLHYPES